MKTTFKAKFLNQYLAEIFGSDVVNDPILSKPLSQKTKYELKKLGGSIREEYKRIVTQLQELIEKHSEIIEVNIPTKEGEAPKTDKTKKIKESEEEEFKAAAKELEEIDVEIEHADFAEKDFIDRNTGEVIASNTYYNLLDLLLWEREEATV